MGETAPEDKPPEDSAAEPEELYGVSSECVRATRDALETEDAARVQELIEPLHPADLADLLERLSSDERERFIAATRHRIEPETLSHLDERVREEVIELLGPQRIAAALSELDSDDAVDLLEDLDEESKRRILESIPAEERAILEEGLTYPEDSAGRMMQRELVAVPSFWTVGQTIDFLRASHQLPDDFYDLFIVDPAFRPLGAVPLSRVIRARRAVKLADLMETDLRTVPVTMDQEAVAHLFRQYGLVSAPVVSESGRLVGVITVDDVVHVIDEEAEEDLMGLGGVGETDFHAPATETAWRRLRWLLVTLVNTVIASIVISQFEATIEAIVAVAVLMPIVAAMGGNAGMQVVTVTVRALATRDMSPKGNVWRPIAKELFVAMMNATVFAAIMGSIAALWFASIPLGIVLGAAMIFNMLWAGLAGTVIPVVLARLGMDPAVSAGPFLTTTTDVLGFFVFLGLATLFLL
ncbi:magnesium transporter [Rhodospirillaceae bacterium SYSU D60014]|uniref:magnesium transporter n=1 Tax=Virgifigura deserti TaxID=2268457 RepID=UPI000E66392A